MGFNTKVSCAKHSPRFQQMNPQDRQYLVKFRQELKHVNYSAFSDFQLDAYVNPLCFKRGISGMKSLHKQINVILHVWWPHWAKSVCVCAINIFLDF